MYLTGMPAHAVQLIELVLGNPEDTTAITLLHANRAERDILAADKLRELAVSERAISH